jgi:hypothetical protein
MTFVCVFHHVLVCTCMYLYAPIWILATTISSVGLSISSVTFDIEDFDIECAFDIDFLHLRYRMSIPKVYDIEGLIIRYRKTDEGHKPLISKVMNRVVDIEVSCLRYRTNISNKHRLISHVNIVYDIEGLSDVRYRRSCHNISDSILYTI